MRLRPFPYQQGTPKTIEVGSLVAITLTTNYSRAVDICGYGQYAEYAAFVSLVNGNLIVVCI